MQVGDAQDPTVSFLNDGAIDKGVERVLQSLAEPFLVGRALVALRSPSHTMDCAVRLATGSALRVGGPEWLVGRAVIAPGRLVFRMGSVSPTRLEFAVCRVVETVYERKRRNEDPGPRSLGVRLLHTQDGEVFWSAHRRVLS